MAAKRARLANYREIFMRRGKKSKGLAEQVALVIGKRDREDISRALDEALSRIIRRLRDGAPLDEGDLATLKPCAGDCGPILSKRLEKASEEEFEALLWVARKLDLRNTAAVLKKAAIMKELPLALRSEALEAAEALGTEEALGPLFEQVRAAEVTKEKIEAMLGQGPERVPISPLDLAAEIRRCAPYLRQGLIEMLLAKAPAEYITEVAGADEEIGLELAQLIGAGKGANPAVLLPLLLSRSQSKKVQKGLKKARFRLKSRGIEVPEVETRRSEPSAGALPTSRDEGYLSGFDSQGNRVIMLGLRRPLEGIYHILGLANDFSGLKIFEMMEVSRKDYRALVEKIKDGIHGMPLVEADAAYCVHLMKEAHSTCIELGGEPPSGYFEANAILSKAGRDFQRPIIYELIDAGEVASDPALLRGSPDLLDDENHLSWLFRGAIIDKYALKFSEAENSPIILADYQKEERLSAIIDESLREFFSPINLRLMRRKLEEAAYFYHLVGEGKAAKLALAAALYFEREDFHPARHPLLPEIMEDSLSKAISNADSERRIILPGSGIGGLTREITHPSFKG